MLESEELQVAKDRMTGIINFYRPLCVCVAGIEMYRLLNGNQDFTAGHQKIDAETGRNWEGA